MSAASSPGPQWKQLFSNTGFVFYFTGMFISLFGTGMNFAGVTLYVLGKTHSTVQVSFTVILLTLPRLVVPPLGGVLIDRVDRRYLGISLDLARAAVVLFAAATAAWGRLDLWQLYAMVLLLGIGFAVYWSSSVALLQELIEPEQLIGANSAVLIAVQGGMLVAGGLVGLVYEHAGLAGILGIDGATYVLSALCFYRMRSGHFPPYGSVGPLSFETPPSTAAAVAEAALEVEPETRHGILAEIEEGLAYLRAQPTVLALGVTYSCMMAGVISANVLVVALAVELLHAGPHGYGFMQLGWALGAIVGGLAAGPLSRRRPFGVLIAALFVLAAGHALFPYAGFLLVAVAMNALFGACRAFGAVLTQSSILAVVPRRLMGRTQSAFAVIATLLQIVMSFALGWVGEHVSLQIAFLVLGMIYGVAVFAAARARTLCEPSPERVPAT